MTDRFSYDAGPIELSELMSAVDYQFAGLDRLPELTIRTIISDSRKVDESSLFVALPGTVTDGHLFIKKAVEAGCRAVVVEKKKFDQKTIKTTDVCVIEVDDCREAYGKIASAFYGNPANKLKMIGITGTNGKTSITYLLENLLLKNGYRVGVIGTVDYRYQDSNNNPVSLTASLTTPEPLMLQKLLYTMVQSGVEIVLMEVSSHALHQKRVSGIQYDIAVFTNLSHDHLDYHRDMEDYFQAKLQLFTNYLLPSGQAVVCTGIGRVNESWSRRIVQFCLQKKISCTSCGDSKDDDVVACNLGCSLEKTVLDIRVQDQITQINSPLIGRFNGENLLNAFGVGLAMGFAPPEISKGLAGVKGVPGRLQRIEGCPDDPLQPVVFVDYAHTPDALEKVLATLADLPHESLYTVFGCGGDRDREKRSLMGEIAAKYSDVVIVTDDNPRSESPGSITDQIEKGIKGAGLRSYDPSWLTKRGSGEKGYLILHERKGAIKAGVLSGSKGDIVLVAGKGHETYQLSRSGKRFFDDRLEILQNLCCWTIRRVLAAVDGKLAETIEKKLGDVSTDSRTIKEGDIFVALKGENFDGHNFVGNVVKRGCGCLILSSPVSENVSAGVPQVIVPNTLKALGNLAAYRRQSLKKVSKPVVIGITGSCGKTTVKEMVAAIMCEKWPDDGAGPENRVLKTRGNLNNLIGLPLSLLPAGVGEKVLVMEMGMNRPGEIERLTEISDPDIACITNVHPAHLLGLQTIEGVARAKEELFAGVRDDSRLVINLNDPHISTFANKYSQDKITFSVAKEAKQQGAQVWATDVELLASGCARFTLHIEAQEHEITLGVAGLHNVENGLAAAAMAHLAGAGMGDIVGGLQAVRSVDKRMEKIVAKNGCSILNDTYNANPASMKAGLTTLCQFRTGKRVAILGDMFELGDTASEAHYQIGRFAAGQGVDQLLVVGEFAGEVVRGATDNGMKPEQTAAFTKKDDMITWLSTSGLTEELGEDDWVLIKGSRGMKLESVLPSFL